MVSTRRAATAAVAAAAASLCLCPPLNTILLLFITYLYVFVEQGPACDQHLRIQRTRNVRGVVSFGFAVRRTTRRRLSDGSDNDDDDGSQSGLCSGSCFTTKYLCFARPNADGTCVYMETQEQEFHYMYTLIQYTHLRKYMLIGRFCRLYIYI